MDRTFHLGDLPNHARAFRCPADGANTADIGTFVALHTYYDPVAGTATLIGFYLPNPSGSALGRTDYVGCAGGMGVTQNPNWDRWRGLLSNRSRNTFVSPATCQQHAPVR